MLYVRKKMLKEKAVGLYLNEGKNCAVAILSAANDAYGLGLGGDAVSLVGGFGTGLGCGKLCGALGAAICVLTKKYASKMEKEAFQALEADFVKRFEVRFSSLDCADIAAVYKREDERRCSEALGIAADLLEGFISSLESKDAVPESEVKRLKGLGFLRDKRYGGVFNVRVITINGKMTAEKLRAVTEAAKKYGSGEVTMTTRLTLEIQGVHYADADALTAFLAENGLETGGTGSKVRPVVSCKGTTCQYGLVDTFALSEKIHEIYYKGWHDVTLPHKFKIAVGGCPNNCVKPDLNDLGIIGQRVPEIDLSKCRSCKVCQVEKACPIHVSKLTDGKITIDENECNHCGRCVGKCPFGAIGEKTVGYKIYIGGRWGKKVAHGKPIRHVFTGEDEVLAAIEKALLIFRDEGVTGERFADTVERLGFDYVEDKILNAEIDKESILAKTVKGGATC